MTTAIPDERPLRGGSRDSYAVLEGLEGAQPTELELTDQLLAPIFHPPRWLSWAIAATGSVALFLFLVIAYTATTGIGLWGNNIPVAWAFAITDFVWWIGIGHAGTFISAFLLLLEQKWRTSINRVAEAMTLFALMQAAIFPILHLGRPWFFYWLFPYPSTMEVWPQFRSALVWDAAAIGTYFFVSLLFWYSGLIPDMALARDRARGIWRRRVYGVFALGWYGHAMAWNRYRIAYGLLAGITTPLVISVESIIGTDFATAVLPGWHSTIVPPYFFAGALYSGFALVLTIMIPLRRLYRLENVVTKAHLDAMGKMALLTGNIVAYAWAAEYFMAWWTGDPTGTHIYMHVRPVGPYAAIFWIVVFGIFITPQLLWSRTIRTNPVALFSLTIIINVSMWLEAFIVIVSSLSGGHLPSTWRAYSPTAIDLCLLGGTLGFFLFLFLLFIRFFPFIPISDLKRMTYALRHEARRVEAAREQWARERDQYARPPVR